MSTRCQVKVKQEGLTWDEEITLYHHTDGYPQYMLPVFWKAYNYKDDYTNTNGWQKGRAGKVASFLCWADPGVFEPEDSHQLHGDIEYYYILYVVNPNGGSIAENPRWEVEIYQPKDFKKFWDNPIMENLKLLKKRAPLERLIKSVEKVKAVE